MDCKIEVTEDIIKVNEMDCEMPNVIPMMPHFEFVAVNQIQIFYYYQTIEVVADLSIIKYQF